MTESKELTVAEQHIVDITNSHPKLMEFKCAIDIRLVKIAGAVVEVGTILTEAKQFFKDMPEQSGGGGYKSNSGMFGEWCEYHFDFTSRTRTNYMNAAQQYPKGLPSGVKKSAAMLMSAPSYSAEGREKLEAAAASGQKITVAMVKEHKDYKALAEKLDRAQDDLTEMLDEEEKGEVIDKSLYDGLNNELANAQEIIKKKGYMKETDDEEYADARNRIYDEISKTLQNAIMYLSDGIELAVKGTNAGAASQMLVSAIRMSAVSDATKQAIAEAIAKNQ